MLDQAFGIMTRIGLHCAPAAHRTLGTYPDGTVRFGFSYFNTLAEVGQAITALTQLVDEVEHGR
jgi:selenocysteine lyase/cysteine desulfurase